ncbi:E3 ubiquitin-protein ligase MARCHF5-like [Neocloeon triangulifer]|uniref:E3 ubiquitin-protein ligase MARCHF5-like n=1 Tax=Neocloeon triangulifer TaxID=2078957 RepID=UPI00286EE4B4|nr:E3 ubiquitin-protein ligase MARCHF5-like [Neocloeon triangulifer]
MTSTSEENFTKPTENGALDKDIDKARYCWVCYASDEEDLLASWVQPCKCRGTTKWVHQMCIQRWIDEKQKGDCFSKVPCPQCGTIYHIVFPEPGFIEMLMNTADNVMIRVSPFVTAGIVLGSLYWTAASYGAVTVLQVMGKKEGVFFMETADPLTLLVGLPSIPLVLILSKLIHWEEYLLQFVRRQVHSLPVLGYLLPSFRYCQPEETRQSVELPQLSDPVSSTRILCSALILPTAATLCGKLLIESTSSNVQRTILGGLIFVGVKGALRIYYKQRCYIRHSLRRIIDYMPEQRSSDFKPEPVADNS